MNDKVTWGHLARGLSNALRREDIRSGSGGSSDKEWRFENNMFFLLPFKQIRNTSGNIPEDSNDIFIVYLDMEIDISKDEDLGSTEATSYRQQPQKKRGSQDEIENETITIVNMMKQR